MALSRLRGRYLVALGHYYHPEEFTCCQCRKVLDEGGFFEEKGSIFCPKCYDTRYAPSCAKCKKKITGVSVPWPPRASYVSPALSLPLLLALCPLSLSALGGGPPKCRADSVSPAGGDARAEDDLARAVLHLRSLQNSHPQPCLLHGGGTALLRERYRTGGGTWCHPGAPAGLSTSWQEPWVSCPALRGSPRAVGTAGCPLSPLSPSSPAAGWCQRWRVASAMTEDVDQSECCILGAEVRLLPAAWWRSGTPCPGCLALRALSLSWAGREMSPGCALLHGDTRGCRLGER